MPTYLCSLKTSWKSDIEKQWRSWKIKIFILNLLSQIPLTFKRVVVQIEGPCKTDENDRVSPFSQHCVTFNIHPSKLSMHAKIGWTLKLPLDFYMHVWVCMWRVLQWSWHTILHNLIFYFNRFLEKFRFISEYGFLLKIW